MVAEPGGLFEGPSGKHSSRVGALKIGDIIKADAETFDPDNYSGPRFLRAQDLAARELVSTFGHGSH